MRVFAISGYLVDYYQCGVIIVVFTRLTRYTKAFYGCFLSLLAFTAAATAAFYTRSMKGQKKNWGDHHFVQLAISNTCFRKKQQ